MDPVSPLPAIASLLVAVSIAYLLAKRFGTLPEQGRYASIDGLRGYLAFFVFLHHSCIWYFYVRTGEWKAPPSNLYTYFGEGSVALFFMIAGFLFFSRLIDSRTRSIEWGILFLSRIRRLVPLYLFVMLLLFLIIAYDTHGILQEPLLRLLKGAVKWIGFTILGAPDLNGVKQTFSIVAGVAWPLPYLLFFYCSLPVLALTIGVIPPFRYILLGIASIVALAFWHPEFYNLLSFSGGIAASFLVRFSAVRRFSMRRIASAISLGCIAIAISAYPSAYGIVPLFLLSTAFALIACGNNMFGLLVSPASRILGEMSYSLYLLHGILLYVTFNLVVGATESRALSPMEYWLVVVGITPVLIFICFVTFSFIESPAVRSTRTLKAFLNKYSTLHFKSDVAD